MESEHLKNREGSDDYDEIIEILKLQKQGKSVREIAEFLGMASSTVFRRIKKAKENNITIPEETVPSVPSVPPVPQAEHTEQVKQYTLSYKDDTNEI